MRNRIKKLKVRDNLSVSRFISEGNPNTGEKIEQERLERLFQEHKAAQEGKDRTDDRDR